MTSVSYDPNPRVGTDKKGEQGIWVNYGYTLDNGYSEGLGHAVLGEVDLLKPTIYYENGKSMRIILTKMENYLTTGGVD